MYKYIIITNNIKVKDELNTEERGRIDYFDTTYLGVLEKVEEYIEKGHKLLTHPLSGSIKPNETPYKSIMVTYKTKGETKEEDLNIMTKAIATFKKFPELPVKWTEQIKDDFKLVDFTLIRSSLDSANLII